MGAIIASGLFVLFLILYLCGMIFDKTVLVISSFVILGVTIGAAYHYGSSKPKLQRLTELPRPTLPNSFL